MPIVSKTLYYPLETEMVLEFGQEYIMGVRDGKAFLKKATKIDLLWHRMASFLRTWRWFVRYYW